MNDDFGREFHTWQSEERNRNTGSRAKVGKIKQFKGKSNPVASKGKSRKREIISCCMQARQWVQMWHSHLGDLATPAAIIEALEKCGGGEDIISNIKNI